jgi:hypothetical protein
MLRDTIPVADESAPREINILGGTHHTPEAALEETLFQEHPCPEGSPVDVALVEHRAGAVEFPVHFSLARSPSMPPVLGE